MSVTFLVEEFRQAGARVEVEPVYEGASGKRHTLALAAERGQEFTIVLERDVADAVTVLDAFRAAQDLEGKAVLVASTITDEARRWADRFRVRLATPPAEPAPRVHRDVAPPAPERTEPAAPTPEPATPRTDDLLVAAVAHAGELTIPRAPPRPRTPAAVEPAPEPAAPGVDALLAAATAHGETLAAHVHEPTPAPEPAAAPSHLEPPMAHTLLDEGLDAASIARLAQAERIEAEDAESDPAEPEIAPASLMPAPAPTLNPADAMPQPESENDEAGRLPWNVPDLTDATAQLASLRGHHGLPWTRPAQQAQPRRAGLVQEHDAEAAAGRLRDVRARLEQAGAHTFGHTSPDEPESPWLQALRQL